MIVLFLEIVASISALVSITYILKQYNEEHSEKGSNEKIENDRASKK